MPPPPETLGELAARREGSPTGSPPRTPSRPAGSERPAEEQRTLLAAISKLCALQKQYGKTAAELETLLDGYLWLLDDLPTPTILGAMREYANRHNDIPTPADIRNVVHPPQPPLSAAVYVDIRRRMREVNQFIMPEEKAYVRAFEEQEMAKVRGGTPELRAAQLEALEYHGGATGE